MARGITQTQINNAVDALLQRGMRPTTEKLRTDLGTGSPNTLARMRDTWWAELAECLAMQARADVTELQTALTDAPRTVKDTQAMLEAMRLTADGERGRLRADLERAVATQDRWLRELDHAREDTKTAVREAKAAHSELAREKARRLRL
jgi:hypothetical protein